MKKLIFSLAVSLATTAAAQTRVIDGDTIEAAGVTYRLNGIDAPEAGQKCGSWACGQAAIDRMANLAEGRDVDCKRHGQDGYGRTIATCYVEGNDIGAIMIRDGFAWAFVKYSDVYVADEALARSERLGIWRHDSQPPWEYRAQRWARAEAEEQQAPPGCPIKGNISRNGKIYHPPWSPWYGRTRINTAKGERWFCDEAEAVAAGWRAPRWR
ncbi:thermonuclease family protein [Mameliella sp.]|uniref:thermonuclease family protein n=1 Tax=Mameliella sp. TaxID=1924940 RepID=UPI003BA8AF7F